MCNEKFERFFFCGRLSEVFGACFIGCSGENLNLPCYKAHCLDLLKKCLKFIFFLRFDLILIVLALASEKFDSKFLART